MRKYIIPTLLFVLLICFSCNKSPTEPNPENENIPWDIISGKLAYSRTTLEDGLTGFLFVANGSSRTVTLVKAAKGVQFADLAWKLDGSLITYSDFDDNTDSRQIFNIKPDGSSLEHIYSSEGHCSYPAWSRDGRLAYWYNGPFPHMDEIRIDGNTFFNKAFCNQSRPAWSPDGNHLVISLRDSSSQGSLYKVNLSDTSFTPLLIAQGDWDNEIFSDPIYSPNGAKIAYVKDGTSLDWKSEIWIINADGSNAERLTSDHSDFYPAWSPDGKYIVFARVVSGKSYIFAVNVSDRSVVQITQKEGSYPTWIQ